jgi:hypothetical protein
MRVAVAAMLWGDRACARSPPRTLNIGGSALSMGRGLQRLLKVTRGATPRSAGEPNDEEHLTPLLRALPLERFLAREEMLL